MGRARRLADGRASAATDWLPIYGGEAVRLDGAVIGRLRSVAFGQTVGRTIGTSTCRRTLAEGTPIEVDVFDERVPAASPPTSSSTRPARGCAAEPGSAGGRVRPDGRQPVLEVGPVERGRARAQRSSAQPQKS